MRDCCNLISSSGAGLAFINHWVMICYHLSIIGRYPLPITIYQSLGEQLPAKQWSTGIPMEAIQGLSVLVGRGGGGGGSGRRKRDGLVACLMDKTWCWTGSVCLGGHIDRAESVKQSGCRTAIG